MELGIVRRVDIDQQMQEAYLDYAMSVIVSRALPDVRDGLKPSQRRILYAMHRLNVYPGRKPYKCAKICGDTSGDFHPHGEAVIYPTLVHMAQPWAMRTIASYTAASPWGWYLPSTSPTIRALFL